MGYLPGRISRRIGGRNKLMILACNNPSELCCAKPTSLCTKEALELGRSLRCSTREAQVCADLRGIAKPLNKKRLPCVKGAPALAGEGLLYNHFARFLNRQYVWNNPPPIASAPLCKGVPFHWVSRFIPKGHPSVCRFPAKTLLCQPCVCFPGQTE